MTREDAGTRLRYTVRTSSRARHAHLVVSPYDGVVVVVPRRFDTGKIPAIVASKAEWIHRAQRRIECERASIDDGAAPARHADPVLDADPADCGNRDELLPDGVNLRAVGENLSVRYDSAEGAGRSRVIGGELLLVAPASRALEVLQRWLGNRARSELVPWLETLAEREGLSISATSIRAQQSRWASCSAAGRVSLNRNLLFLPPELVEHVLLHELCHRREMNHSARFWKLLESIDPETRARTLEIRTAWKYVPTWAGRRADRS